MTAAANLAPTLGTAPPVGLWGSAAPPFITTAALPERFARKPPNALPWPEAVWINPPSQDEDQSLKPLHYFLKPGVSK